MTKVTVYDIARELNISVSTVSRVLNNSSLVSDKKKKLILETAQRMNYKQRIIKKQSQRAILKIRLFLPRTKYSYMHLFYDVAELADGIRLGFNNTKINLILSTMTDTMEFFNSKKTGETDGCIFAFCTPGKELQEELDGKKIPFILLNREDPKHNYILVDNNLGMERLVNSMHKKKGDQSKFCYIGFSPLAKLSNMRADAVKLATTKKNISFSNSDIFTIENINEISNIIDKIIDTKYNGILCFNDLTAVACYLLLLQRRVSIPEDICLSGFDHSSLLYIFAKKIDTIEFSAMQLGTGAGKWLRSWIIDKETVTKQERIKGKYIKGDTI